MKNPFKRKKKVESKDEKDKLSNKSYSYRVTLTDPLGKSPREIDTFGVEKSRDSDGIVWLINDKKDFKEVFPLDNDFNTDKTLEEVNKELKELRSTTRKPKENKLNKPEKILRLEKMKKALDNPNGSFIKIDRDGIPHIMYIRYRTSYIPLKYNIDFSTIHTPAEPLINNVLSKQIEKAKKYHQVKENLMTGGMLLFLFLLLIWTAILVFASLKMFTAVDDSRVQDLQNRIDTAPLICAEMYGQAGDNFYQSSIYSLNVTKTIYNNMNPNVNSNTQVTGLG